MAESRGGKEDRRLKDSFERLWEKGTDYVKPEQFQAIFTSCQLKVKAKSLNVAGLQIADIIAHSSRNEILTEQGLFKGNIWPFGKELIKILKSKYDQQEGRIFGKKFL